MRDLEQEEVLLIALACEALHDVGQDRYPYAFFAQSFDTVQARLSAAYREEDLSDVLQCRAIVERAMVPLM